MQKDKDLKVWTSKHDGFYLPGCSVIIAETKEQALEHLNKQLKRLNLAKSDMSEVEEMPFIDGSVRILFDGDY